MHTCAYAAVGASWDRHTLNRLRAFVRGISGSDLRLTRPCLRQQIHQRFLLETPSRLNPLHQKTWLVFLVVCAKIDRQIMVLNASGGGWLFETAVAHVTVFSLSVVPLLRSTNGIYRRGCFRVEASRRRRGFEAHGLSLRALVQLALTLAGANCMLRTRALVRSRKYEKRKNSSWVSASTPKSQSVLHVEQMTEREASHQVDHTYEETHTHPTDEKKNGLSRKQTQT